MEKKNKKLKQIKYPILWVYRQFLNPQVVGAENIIRVKGTANYPHDAATVKVTHLRENLIFCTVYIVNNKQTYLARLLCHCCFRPSKQQSHVSYNGLVTMDVQGDVNRILNEVYDKIVLMGWGKLPDPTDALPISDVGI